VWTGLEGWVEKYGTSLDDGAEVDPSTHPSPNTHSKILSYNMIFFVVLKKVQ
jgi:hypothetical protein